MKRSKTPANWKVKFLEVYRQSGNLMHAARQAGVARNTVYAARDRDEKFRIAMEFAEVDALETLEIEAYRRAVEGTRRPVFYKGDQCGYVMEYSDALLTLLLRARAPEKYRDSKDAKVVHSGPGGGPIAIREVVIERPIVSVESDSESV